MNPKSLKNKRTKPEKKLVRSLKKGNVQAFEILYKKYIRQIYYFSMKYLKDQIEAEEIVQCLFMKVWEKRDTLNEELSFSSFLYRIAVNDIYNLIKKKSYELKYLEYEKLNAKDTYYDIYDQVLFNDFDHQLEKLIDQLPPQRKKIFLMSRRDNLSYQEISSKLNISIRTVENHIFRTLKYLKDHLVKEY